MGRDELLMDDLDIFVRQNEYSTLAQIDENEVLYCCDLQVKVKVKVRVTGHTIHIIQSIHSVHLPINHYLLTAPHLQTHTPQTLISVLSVCVYILIICHCLRLKVRGCAYAC